MELEKSGVVCREERKQSFIKRGRNAGKDEAQTHRSVTV